MVRIHPRTLLKAALLPAALLMAAGGSQAAFASQAGAATNVTSGTHTAPSPDSYYTMQLSPSSVTVRAGVRGYRHRDVAEQRSHRHLHAARSHHHHALAGSSRGDRSAGPGAGAGAGADRPAAAPVVVDYLVPTTHPGTIQKPAGLRPAVLADRPLAVIGDDPDDFGDAHQGANQG